MSLLLKICEIANDKFLGNRNLKVRFKGIVEKPRIFTMVYWSKDGQENLGFYHICSPRLLLAKMLATEFKSNDELNILLNDHVAKVVPVDIGREKPVTLCGKCGEEVPTQVASKLDIIGNVRKLKL